MFLLVLDNNIPSIISLTLYSLCVMGHFDVVMLFGLSAPLPLIYFSYPLSPSPPLLSSLLVTLLIAVSPSRRSLARDGKLGRCKSWRQYPLRPPWLTVPRARQPRNRQLIFNLLVVVGGSTNRPPSLLSTQASAIRPFSLNGEEVHWARKDSVEAQVQHHIVVVLEVTYVLRACDGGRVWKESKALIEGRDSELCIWIQPWHNIKSNLFINFLCGN